MIVRPAAVAGLFYPVDCDLLRSQVFDFIGNEKFDDLFPKALIVPHAGFIYSGCVAGSGYSLVKKLSQTVKRVILIGPCHKIWFKGVALSDSQYFETPLGKVKLDSATLTELIKFNQTSISAEAHADEHSIEVQLPFLQSIIPQFELLPIVVGEISIQELAQVIEFVWGGEETLIVISSDLSHFLDYETAVICDTKTSKAIENFQIDSISHSMACGSSAIKSLLMVAKKKQLNVKTIKQCNSGDTAGGKDRVVGYGTYAIY